MERFINHLEDLTSQLSTFLTQPGTSQGLNKEGVANVTQSIAKLVENILVVRQGLEDLNQKTDLNDMPYAAGVTFDKNKCCMPNTRTSLIRRIRDWVDRPQVEGNETDQRVLLLTGVARSGKSSVARSVCDHYRKLNRLASSFFFTSQSSDCPGGDRVFCTIARDIADRFPLFKPSLVEVLRKGGRSVRYTKQSREQLMSFIVHPCEKLDTSEVFGKDPILIVIDALDECPEEHRDEFIRTLVDEGCDLPANFRLLITSRQVGVPCLLGTKHVLHLDMDSVDPAEAKADVALYFRNRLSGVARELDDPRRNPRHHKDWMEQLVLRSESYFYWAETACNKITSSISQTCSDVLAGILKKGILEMDVLFMAEIRKALDVDGDEDSKDSDTLHALHVFKAFMRRIIILKTPLSAHEINFMQFYADTEDNDFPYDVSHLACYHAPILNGGSDIGHPISFVHSSFRDFLLDKKRSGIFYVGGSTGNLDVDLADAHYALANACIGVINAFVPGQKPNSELTSKENRRAVAYCELFAEHFNLSGRNWKELGPVFDPGAVESFLATKPHEYPELSEKDREVLTRGMSAWDKIRRG